MSGHSKWSTIKHQKGVTDARRGQLFTKLAREITVAARQGGGDPDSNFRLRLAVQKARENNMPQDNVDRAIKRGAGGGEGGGDLEEALYEGYGPGGVAIMLQALTDNRKRTVSDVRSSFTRAGGSLGEAGCVSWNFESRGVVTAEVDPNLGEEIALAAIDAGAEDFKLDGSFLEIYTGLENLEALRSAMEEQGVNVTSAELSMVPRNTIMLDARVADQTLRLLDQLEELDDVQKVYSNADFPDEALEKYGS
ncbi:MAG: YebC/PmpR family DNA-binding transcriptional regulator [Chloroflexota bacterium]|nr:YebC/PmpR family DNA-binding transcriptional regulator [Chloroflexota bacterium]MDE2942281.1 YebC/PmpR family DNA-binding transcriptional regulator [Chloroflexota bacterium]MDE3266990.1 YebC/PmpR family DNA-binding transcriptional regulator [Chloroflexota bacterium]